MYDSVVRIFATTQRPDYRSPWQSCAPSSSTGSGVVVEGGRILTGAHVVAEATFLQVQKVSDPNKMVARVEAVCHDCDLALLRLSEPARLAGVEPQLLGGLPDLRDRVSVVGYPVGGEEISITEGVVSRVEVQRYSHSQRQLLAVTVDAAINEGNSGGPVYQDGRIAGIAFQALEDAENIGEMVPAALIRQFLLGVEKGRPAQIPGLGVMAQHLENPSLRERSGLRDGTSGVLVIGVEYAGSAWGHLQVGDAILEIDGYDIANNATVRYADRYRTSFDVFLGDHHVGDEIHATVLRKGTIEEIEIELRPYQGLVPRSRYDESPRYVIFAGFVFQPLSLDFLRTWNDWWEKAPAELLHLYYSGLRTEERQEAIVLSQVLADDISVGYEDSDDVTVELVNGVLPRNLGHFVELLQGAKDVVDIKVSSGCHLVVDVAAAAEAGGRILDRYHIASDRSSDLA